jgi:hypothetical protein
LIPGDEMLASVPAVVVKLRSGIETSQNVAANPRIRPGLRRGSGG